MIFPVDSVSDSEIRSLFNEDFCLKLEPATCHKAGITSELHAVPAESCNAEQWIQCDFSSLSHQNSC